MPNSRKISTIVGTVVVLAITYACITKLHTLSVAQKAIWIGVASLIIGAISAIATWLTWIYPLESAKNGKKDTDKPTSAPRNSIGVALNSQIAIGKKNRINQSRPHEK